MQKSKGKVNKLKQSAPVDPEKFRQMKQLEQQSTPKNTKKLLKDFSRQSPNIKITLDELKTKSKNQQEDSFAMEEIERLLGATEFDDQLDANNAKLHKALFLSLAELKKFKTSEKELMQKVRNLESMIQNGRPENIDDTMANTSKFGKNMLGDQI